jgi:hypothetical protein
MPNPQIKSREVGRDGTAGRLATTLGCYCLAIRRADCRLMIGSLGFAPKRVREIAARVQGSARS